MKPYLEILKLVWPLALGMVNNAVMQFVDRAYLAHEGMDSLEAVLPATTLAWIFMSFFQSVIGYAGVFVAQYHGAGDSANVRRGYYAGLWLTIVSGALMLPLVPLGDWIFALTAASPALAAKEGAYYDIAIMGGAFVFAQMAATAYFTGQGKTRLVFWVNLGGNLLNIALDPLLIFGVNVAVGPLHLSVPRLGLAGAAYATVFSQAVQYVALALVASRTAPLRGMLDRALVGFVRRLIRFGVPAGGYEVLNMLSFTIFVFLTGRVGDVDFAVSNACFTVNYLLFAPMTGFAIGAQTLVAQSLGRGNVAEAKLAFRRTLQLGLALVAIACAVVLVFNRPILALFAPESPAACERFFSLGFQLMLLMSAWMLFDAADVMLSGALKGAGDTRFVFWWMLVTAFLVWMPLAAFASFFNASMTQLWLTTVIYVVIICLGSFVRWYRGDWQRIQILSQNTVR